MSALLDIKAMGNSAKVSYLLIIGEARLGYSSAMVESQQPHYKQQFQEAIIFHQNIWTGYFQSCSYKIDYIRY